MRFDNLDDWLSWQEGLHFTSIDLGLDRCREVAERLGLTDPNYKVITIAGTNGKGSSAAMLERVYHDAGYTTGTYTSPHLVSYNERIRLNCVQVPDDLLCGAFDAVDRARGDISLTYFEFGTLAALQIFQDTGVDLAILEVGLGGRLDAVNILDPDAGLICSVGMDHQEWLGDTRELIGYEKAGIMRPGRVVVCADPDPPRSVLEYAASTDALLSCIGRDFDYRDRDNCWDWYSGVRTVTDLPVSGLLRSALRSNGAGVIKIIDSLQAVLPVPEPVLRDSIGKATLPGRFQVIDGPVRVILDVAHNQPAAEMLARNLAAEAIPGLTRVIIGVLADKDHRAILTALRGVTDYWYTVTLDGPRGTNGASLAGILGQLGIHNNVEIFDTIAGALGAAREAAGRTDVIVVTGSFLTVGAALQCLQMQAVENI